MTSFHQGVRRLLVAHGFLSEMAMIWSSFGGPQTMKFLKLRFGERPHVVSEQWPLLYRGPDEVHRKCIGTDIICREFACRQESSLVVYCREFSRWQQRKPKFRSEKRWKKHQDMVSFHTLKWVSDVLSKVACVCHLLTSACEEPDVGVDLQRAEVLQIAWHCGNFVVFQMWHQISTLETSGDPGPATRLAKTSRGEMTCSTRRRSVPSWRVT